MKSFAGLMLTSILVFPISAFLFFQTSCENKRTEHQEKPKVDPSNMVYVVGGSFEMGSESGESGEKPVRRVYVSSFSIGKYEVTQREWKEVMGSNPSYFMGDDLPVANVSWNDAVEYCEKLSQKTGKKYRLPTEAEWEYAARGGNKSKGYTYSGSNNIDEVARYLGNSDRKTHRVGGKQPNELGIYHMSGNVSEWCSDWYGENYYSNSPTDNPKGPVTGEERVTRGGSCYDLLASNCRVSLRGWSSPAIFGCNLGFRVVSTE